VSDADEDSVARELLAVATALMYQKSIDTRGLWPRASALLARQSLEVALKTYWSAVAPGVEEASMRSQLLCLESYLSPELGRQAYQVWNALSRATHHHPYELSPTREELSGWCDTVATIVEKTERVWRR